MRSNGAVRCASPEPRAGDLRLVPSILRLDAAAAALIQNRPRLIVGVGALLVALLVALVSGEALRAAQARERAARWELHTLQVQQQTQAAMNAILAAETGLRGFLLTGEEAFLRPYYDGAEVALTHTNALRTLTADNPAQSERMDEIDALVSARLADLAILLEHERAGRTGEARRLIRQGAGLARMEALRAAINAVLQEEGALLAARRAQSLEAARAQRRSDIMLIGAAIALIVVLSAAALSALRAAGAARRYADDADLARRVQAQLAQRVEQAVAAQRQSEAALRQSQKMEAVGQLAGGVAHDFNNMLAIVIGSLEMAERRRAAGQADIERFLKNAMEGARRAAALTQRLLAYARQQPLEPRTIDVNKVVVDLTDLLRRSIGEAVTLKTALAPDLWRVRIDRHELENAIVNVAVNARDAMPQGGALSIATQNITLDEAAAERAGDMRPGDYVRIDISDTGAGMPAEVMERAFDPFFTTKSVGKGTGLGLSQVFGFAKQSGGHAALASTLGAGTTIALYLPRWGGQEDGAHDGDAAREEAPPRGAATEIVLVVEDDDRVRVMSVEAVRELGYTALHAASGAEALQMLSDTPGVSLLFTDMVMPDMSGRALVREAKARFPQLKVAYTTGYAHRSASERRLLDDDAVFIAKPFTLATLARSLRRALDG
ncbi:MAG: CHASE3 domain-containing protein [Hyphomonadaceae bacterium]|nr:CHASE3 domain-containing protein [Hyphomonadaceae bacterium]